MTLELPDEIAGRAERLASLTHRDMTAVLYDALAVTLPPLDSAIPPPRPVSELSDEEVVALSQLRMRVTEERRLAQLLDKQQEETLSQTGRQELMALMQNYEVKLLRQAEGLAEVVRRGLREPLVL